MTAPRPAAACPDRATAALRALAAAWHPAGQQAAEVRAAAQQAAQRHASARKDAARDPFPSAIATPTVKIMPARLLLLACCALYLLAAPAAASETIPTRQHVQANAAFLIYAPPPAEPGAVCFVDSGLDVNPDTQGKILASMWWDASVAVHQSVADGDIRGRHGTHMASVAGAAVNGWGSVGAWPQLKLVSVQAADSGTVNFPFMRYSRAVRQCIDARQNNGLPVRVVNMSLGGTRSPDAQELERLRDIIMRARSAWAINVVAAAGNDPGPVFYPARIAEVFGVGGAAETGAACPRFATGEGLDLFAPGCPVDLLHLPTGLPSLQEGTSHAAAFASAVLAALRSYRPDLTPDQAEALLAATARGGSLDAEAAFRAAGLGWVVEQGNAALRATGVNADGTRVRPAPFSELPPDDPEAIALRTPRATITYRRGVLRVRVRNRPADATVRVDVRARRAAKRGSRGLVRKTMREQQSVLVMRAWLRGKRLHDVRVRFEPADYDVARDSKAITWRPRR